MLLAAAAAWLGAWQAQGGMGAERALPAGSERIFELLPVSLYAGAVAWVLTRSSLAALGSAGPGPTRSAGTAALGAAVGAALARLAELDVHPALTYLSAACILNGLFLFAGRRPGPLRGAAVPLLALVAGLLEVGARRRGIEPGPVGGAVLAAVLMGAAALPFAVDRGLASLALHAVASFGVVLLVGVAGGVPAVPSLPVAAAIWLLALGPAAASLRAGAPHPLDWWRYRKKVRTPSASGTPARL